MTLQRSLILSLLLHLVLFGTGIAFARYGTVLFPQSERTIMVTLLGSQGESFITENRKRNRGERSEHAARPGVPVFTDDGPNKQVRQEHSESDLSESLSAGVEQAPGPGGKNGEGDGGPSAGNDSGSLGPEHWAVIVSSIEKVKNYPRLARERGIEGVVRVRFRLKSQGQVDTVEIVKSSGYPILDEASVRTVHRAGPLPYVKGWVEVPIAYVLK